MRLRAKGLLIVAVATIGTSIVAQTVAWLTVQANIEHVESAVASRDVARAQQALQVQRDGLRDTARYWGIWDDAYAFAQDRNPRFIESNLYGTVLEEAGVDVLLFLDVACRVLYGTSGEASDLKTEAAAAFAEARCAPGHRDLPGAAESGFLGLPSGVLLVSTQPILTSKREGPPRGTLLVGRRVDRRLVAAVRGLARLDVDLLALDRGEVPAEVRRAFAAGRSAAPQVLGASGGELASYAAIPDLEGRDIMVLRATTPRDVHRHAQALLWRMSLVLGVVGLVACVVVVLMLDRGILARLALLLGAVRKIGASADLSERVPVCGRDELAGLAAAINTTLATLEESERRARAALAELAAAKGALEERVLERTAALEEAVVAHRASEHRVRQIVDLLPQLVFATDAQGRIVLANRALKEAFGVGDAEIVGRRGEEVAARSPGLAGLVAPDPSAALATEAQVVDARAQVRILTSARLALEPDSATGLALVGVATDVTEQRRLEEALRHSQKLDGIGRLAGGIAHDFNNLLAAILSCAHLAADGLAKEDARREEIEEIRCAAERAAELTRQLLAFARRQRTAVRTVDLNALPLGMEKLLRRVLREDIELELRLGQGMEPVGVDVGQMEQVLMNLVLNARDAMPDGGKLIIQTRRVDAAELADLAPATPLDAPASELLVADTGGGMTPEVLARLFEPFFTTKEIGKGTGLGLATCYGIVRSLGGLIWAESAPGQGSRFHILLPRSAHPVIAPPAGTVRLIVRGAETVLLVEDNDLVRASTARLLERQGYVVLVAPDGPAALTMTRAHEGRIDLVIADVVMPGMSGPEVAGEIERLRPGTPILFVSGYADEALERRTRGVLGGELLVKPFTADDLGRRVRELIGRGPAPSAVPAPGQAD